VTYTVYSYFQEKYGIRLKYPKMPMICTGKGRGRVYEWFPVELLFQSFGKMKNTNEPQQVQDVLKFYDEFSGTNIVKKVEDLTNNPQIKEHQEKFLKLFGITKNYSAVTLTAKVLEEPCIQFKERPSFINDGSWNLRDVKFDKPATLASFALINFTGRENAVRFFGNVLNSCKKHGMQLPFNIGRRDESNLVNEVACSGDFRNGNCSDSFKNAVEKAKEFFWYDGSGFYKNNNIWHKTRALKPNGEAKWEWEEVLLIPPPQRSMSQFGIMLGYGPTHNVEHDGTTSQARLQVGVMVGNKKEIVDPFNLFFDDGRYEAIISGTKQKVEYGCVLFQLENQTILENVEISKPIIIVGENLIQPISMVFAFLPDDKKQNYDAVKKMSHVTFGIPSQCIVKFPKFESKPDQYCSNIALKINTKLSNISNNARAWETSYKVAGSEMKGIPWLSEVPTLVLGFSISHGLGQDSKSIIAGHVALDAGCMQFAQSVSVQSKSDIISNEIMEDMAETLLQHFMVHVGEYPCRVLVYRDGVSEGDFKHVLENECAAIRKVCLKNQASDVLQACGDFSCPPITFIVCQAQHNIRIVPERPVLRHGNVFSGTCVDDEILDVKDSLLVATKDVPREPSRCFEDPNDDGYDFLLTSQGGLKGTSKPVMYRVLLNENVILKPPGKFSEGGSALTKKKLQLCTYHMAFQYGTATKAVRDVPVVKYSKRLAGNVMGYLKYLIDDREVAQSGQVLDNTEKSAFEQKDRNNEVIKRFRLVSTAANESNLPRNILHKLSPYDYELGGLRPPAFPHNSA